MLLCRFVTSEADTINQQTMSDTGYVEQSSDAAIPDPSVIAVDRTDWYVIDRLLVIKYNQKKILKS